MQPRQPNLKSPSDFADEIASVLSRSYRIVARWLVRRVENLFDLYRSFIIFFPLALLAGGSFELTYSGAWLVRAMGWVLTVLFTIFIAWLFIELFRPSARGDTPEAPFLWLICSGLSAVFVLVILGAHYRFQSPMLSVVQRFPHAMKVALFGPHRLATIAGRQLDGVPLNIASTPVHASGSDIHLSIWAEGARSNAKEIIIDLACKTWSDNESMTLRNASGTYLLDQNGRKYELIDDLGEYSFFKGERQIVGGEIYRWTLAFEGLAPGVTSIILRHPQFNDLKITVGLTPPIASIQSGPSANLSGIAVVPSGRTVENDSMAIQDSATGNARPSTRVSLPPTVAVGKENSPSATSDGSANAAPNPTVENDMLRRHSAEIEKGQPNPPTFTRLSIRPTDPHNCEKPSTVFYGTWGPARPAPAGSGELKNPVFLYDDLQEGWIAMVTWAHGFRGTIPVCVVVDDQGNPTDTRFPQPPGLELEQSIRTRISALRYRPGTITKSYREEPRRISVELAYDFVFSDR